MDIKLNWKKMQSGKYNIVWKADDKAGMEVASGTYLVMMKFGSSIQTKKITLIK